MRGVGNSRDRFLDEVHRLGLASSGTAVETSLEALATAGQSSDSRGKEDWSNDRGDGNHDGRLGENVGGGMGVELERAVGTKREP